ncbi:MAG: hypothetical protein LBJ08_05045, partial [Bifidobacteriaceae bacterium]|nr:hypothetical protein [Bifidobacteriaceae bacterium]
MSVVVSGLGRWGRLVPLTGLALLVLLGSVFASVFGAGPADAAGNSVDSEVEVTIRVVDNSVSQSPSLGSSPSGSGTSSPSPSGASSPTPSPESSSSPSGASLPSPSGASSPSSGSSSMPFTGFSLGWLLAVGVGFVAVGLLVRLMQRRRLSGRALGLVLAGVVGAGALAAVGNGLRADAADDDSGPVVVVDKANGSVGGGVLGFGLTDLDSKVVGVEAGVEDGVAPGIAFTVDGVALNDRLQRVGSVSDPEFDGVYEASVEASVDGSVSVGDYRVVVSYRGIDERALISSVQAGFGQRIYNGSSAVVPDDSPVVEGVMMGDDVVLLGLEFQADSGSVGVDRVSATVE